MSRNRTLVSAVLLILTIAGTALSAHQMIVKGTIAALEPARVQIKTGEEKKGESPAWILLNAKTKIVRGKTSVALDQAKLTVGERIVATVDHDAKGVMTALEIQLAAK